MTAATASQTAGPYWHMIDFPEWADLLRPGSGNEAGGRADHPRPAASPMATARRSPDALVEIWQAGPDGRYEDGFHGFGRCASERGGRVPLHHAEARPRARPRQRACRRRTSRSPSSPAA